MAVIGTSHYAILNLDRDVSDPMMQPHLLGNISKQIVPDIRYGHYDVRR